MRFVSPSRARGAGTGVVRIRVAFLAPRDGPAGVVPHPPSPPPVEGTEGPVPDLGRGGAPAADPRRAGGPVFRAVRPPLPDRPRTGGGELVRGAQGVGGGRVLRAGAPPARRCPAPRPHESRPSPQYGRSPRANARGRSLHGAGHREPRLWNSGGCARSQRPTRRGPVDSGGGRPASGEGEGAARVGPRRRAPPCRRRSVQRGRDGAGGDGLPSGGATVRRVPGGIRLSCVPRARRPLEPSETRTEIPETARSGRRDRPGTPWPVAGPTPTSERPARGSMGVPGRQDRAGRGSGGRCTTGAPRGDPGYCAPAFAGGDRPSCVQPFHRRTPRVSRDRRIPTPHDRTDPPMGDARPVPTPAGAPCDREDRSAPQGGG